MTPLEMGPSFFVVMLSLSKHGGMQILNLVIEFGVAESRRLGVSVLGVVNKPLCPLSGDVTLTAFGMTPLELGPGFLVVILSLPARVGS
jgi:hypothetical protein